MTVRMATCRELASDLPSLNKLQEHYWILEKSATPTALLLPWFPSPAKRAKDAATKALYVMLWDYIEERKNTAVPSSDAIDLLLGQGMSNDDIIQFVLGVIFAGVINTGINCTLCHSHLISSLFRDLISDNNFSLLDPPLHLLL
jgi:cytochrome P450